MTEKYTYLIAYYVKYASNSKSATGVKTIHSDCPRLLTIASDFEKYIREEFGSTDDDKEMTEIAINIEKFM